MYVWSLVTLLEQSWIREVVIVAPPDMVPEIKKQTAALIERFPNQSLNVVAGGDTRQESVYLGLQAMIERPPEFVMIHDAARPFLTAEIVQRVNEGVIKCGAVTTGVAPSDTIKRVENHSVAETLDRRSLLLVQTPQAGRYDWLIDAHRSAHENGLATTDDAAVLEAAGHKVGIVGGANFNMKVTQPEDLILAEALAAIVFKDRL